MFTHNEPDHHTNEWVFYLETAGNKRHQFCDRQIIQINCNDDNITWWMLENHEVKKYFANGTLKSILENLPSGGFIKINKSNIINLKMVADIYEEGDKHFVILENKNVLECTPAGWALLKPHLMCFKLTRKK